MRGPGGTRMGPGGREEERGGSWGRVGALLSVGEGGTGSHGLVKRRRRELRLGTGAR